jgi:hypothetical protein
MTGTVSDSTRFMWGLPEYGQAAFMERMEREIAPMKQLYPKAVYVGIADGAQSNWDFLERHTRVQILDFYHATGCPAEVAQVACPRICPRVPSGLRHAAMSLNTPRGPLLCY